MIHAKPNIRTPYNASKLPKHYEKTTGPDMTIPDQSMSIQEILVRYSRGLSTSGIKVPIYEGETDMPDMTHWDLADREAYMSAAAEELQDIKNKLNKKARDKAQAKKEAEEKAKNPVKNDPPKNEEKNG